MSKKIPERSEIAVENTWRLEDLYGSDELWQADLVKFQQQIDALTGFAGKISQSAADLLAYMKLRDEISILADRLGNYAMRRGDQDTRNSHYQGMVGQFTTAYVEADEKTSFETPELLSIPEEKMAEFYHEQPELAQQFGIMSIPTLVFFKEGRVTDTLVGLRDKAAILSLLK